MRLAYFSPLPPATTGIADYSAALLPELARLAKVDLYWDQATPLSRDLGVRPTQEFAARRGEYDAVFYHLGNSRFHSAIYDTLLHHPGIVVLHDGTLHHFFVERTLHLSNAPAYLREMAYAHGAEGYDAAVLVARGAGLFPFYNFPLIARAVDLARGVIVHSGTLRRAVAAARPDARVQVIDHFAFPPVPPTKSRATLLRALGLPRDAFIVASFGQLAYGKRAEAILEAFSQFAASVPRARFIWVGDVFREYDVRPYLRRLGLSARVVLTGRVSEEALANYLALADIAVNLRFPTSGEASGGVMRLLAYGKPTLVSNVGWFAELPSEVVVKVDVGSMEVEDITYQLVQLATDPALYSRMSAAAREFAAAHTPQRAASEYVRFARELAEESHARAA
jgi:glycosyltransferase involved in cell wall biosynthesis